MDLELLALLRSDLNKTAELFLSANRDKIAPNEQISISVSAQVIPTMQVTIDNDTAQQPDVLVKVLADLTRKHRLRQFLDDKGISTLEQVKQLTISSLKMRNVGRVTFTRFAQALKKEGVTCAWIEEMIVGIKSPLQREVESGTIRELNAADWKQMNSALQSSKGIRVSHYCRMIQRLEINNNTLTPLSKLITKSVHRSWWKTYIYTMNNCWRTRSLPYRLRIVYSGESTNAIDGSVQVIMVPQ